MATSFEMTTFEPMKTLRMSTNRMKIEISSIKTQNAIAYLDMR